MHLELSDEQQLYATALREWLAERASPQVVRGWLDTGDTESFERKFVEEGWGAVGFDEQIGGQGGGLLELALTARELGRATAPSSAWMQSALADPALRADPELARAAIEAGASVAVAMAADRIPATSGSVRVVGGRVTGSVRCVLGAARAQRFVVWVNGSGGPALMVVDRDVDGVEVRPRVLLDRSREVADVVFRDAPARRLDASAEPTWASITTRAAVLTAADALGAAERMLALTVEYSKQRKQFGRPIGAFQAVKHTAAQMLVTAESSFSVTFYAAASGLAIHAAVAKAQVCGPCAELADAALTVHGAIGYTWEHDLQLYYKRAKLDRVLFGTPTAWNDRIADSLPLLPAA
jgi:alkylation response protein AidB-like acyl-CoA dehydrogenase